MPRQSLTKMALAAISLVVFCSLMQSAHATGFGNCAISATNDATNCHYLAYCANDICECPMGATGDGVGADGCVANNAAVRYVIKAADTETYKNVTMMTLDEVKGAALCPSGAKGFYARHVLTPEDEASPADGWLEMRCLYVGTSAATAAQVTAVKGAVDALGNVEVYAEPTAQIFNLPTTSSAIPIPPTGMTVDSVSFDTSCAQSGCWVITGTMTTGGSLDDNNVKNNVFNTFFLPFAEIGGDGDLSYDFDYTTGGNSAGGPSDWTFRPVNHPCSSADFDATNGNTQKVTTCCITNTAVGATIDSDGVVTGDAGGFLTNYRTTSAFFNWASTGVTACSGGNGQIIERPGYDGNNDGTADPFGVAFPSDPLNFLGWNPTGFTGMVNSPGVTSLTLMDPFFRQFDFTIELDEVELRSKAGQLRGTVGVEHTVDTFLGLSNFRTTGLEALDTFSTQVNIHLEKTSFFSVSTHGVNEYTFLEYVNMRLVMVYQEDTDFSSDAESADRTVRTSTEGNVGYVQVTFTMGAQYQPNILPDAASDVAGLIPLDSVRAGKGTFFGDSTPMEHVCTDYNAGTFGLGTETTTKTIFDGRVGQPTCGPMSTMCSSPATVPDQFVSFNIPLGMDVFTGASNDLSNNIFVDFVVNAVDTDARDAVGADAPNEGGAPWQMKTTLTASIPIVAGGINIFCDGFTAKTDLKDVANVDIVVGSANDGDELTRLRILEDIASTDLATTDPSEINTDSIESALMTLVIKGEHSYFSTTTDGVNPKAEITNAGTSGYSMELDDVITLHLMEDGQATETNSKETEVVRLLKLAGDDNTDADGVQTEGYKLNGAFMFEVDRDVGVARLQPTAELTAVCPFNPPRPAADNNPLESCILRRDVQDRRFPARTGAVETAMEILAVSGGKAAVDALFTNPTNPTNFDGESTFLTTILGDSEYSKKLAPNFAKAIHDKYHLNGRYRRAYWINPGYEWTPTQTAGKSLFSVSQKIYLFALISLDENWVRRRRMLLQTTSDAMTDNGAGMNAASMDFQQTPQSMMASAFDVPVDKVGLFKLEMQLTKAQACMPASQLQDSLRVGLKDMLDDTASTYKTVQVISLSVDKGDEVCPGTRRSIRKLLGLSSATATINMLVVFKEGANANFDMVEFAKKQGVNSVQPAESNAKITYETMDCTGDNCGEEDSSDKSESSSSNTGLIAGVAGGVVGALLVAIGAVFWMRSRRQETTTVAAVQSINVQDLKSQLADEV